MFAFSSPIQPRNWSAILSLGSRQLCPLSTYSRGDWKIIELLPGRHRSFLRRGPSEQCQASPDTWAAWTQVGSLWQRTRWQRQVRPTLFPRKFRRGEKEGETRGKQAEENNSLGWNPQKPATSLLPPPTPNRGSRSQKTSKRGCFLSTRM